MYSPAGTLLSDLMGFGLWLLGCGTSGHGFMGDTGGWERSFPTLRFFCDPMIPL